MDWASPTTLFQATSMCGDHQGEWKFLLHRVQSYLAAALLIIPTVLGYTPSQSTVSHTGWALCWTTHLGLIHFSATPPQKHLGARSCTHPHLNMQASAGGHSDRLQDHSLCLQMRFNKVVKLHQAGVTIKLFSNRRITLCRNRVALGCLVPCSLMKGCPGCLRSGGRIMGTVN